MATPSPTNTRMCLSCREKQSASELFVIKMRKNGDISTEPSAPGRGIHLCRDKKCVEKAMKRDLQQGLFPGKKGRIPPEIWQRFLASLQS